jgi:hypothetical protein
MANVITVYLVCLLLLLLRLLLCSGTPIPRVEYTPAEIATWGTALSKLKAMYPWGTEDY